MGNGRYTERGRERADDIRGALERNKNGMTHWQLVMELGMNPRNRLDSSLASLDKYGVMVSEDELGRLFLFDESGLYSLRGWDGWI